jgi:hypothetical protein
MAVSTASFEELAQNGRGRRRPALSLSEFLYVRRRAPTPFALDGFGPYHKAAGSSVAALPNPPRLGFDQRAPRADYVLDRPTPIHRRGGGSHSKQT